MKEAVAKKYNRAVDSAVDKFLAQYQRWYSAEQLASLREPAAKVLLYPHAAPTPADAVPTGWYPGAYAISPTHTLDANAADYYVMNPASLLAVLALDPHPGERIADICAAPGGKSIAIAARMRLQGELLSSDLSSERMRRMAYNMRRLAIPQQHDGWQLRLITASAHTLSKDYAAYFDKVLVDAPCSCEAHVLADAKELRKWSSSKSTLLAKRQRKILQSAIKLLRPGGILVYATCSISPLENDGVIEFILKKLAPQIQSLSFTSPIGEATALGTLITPWQHRMGPGYVAVFKKSSSI